jgi:hypothetical protein
MLFPRLFLLVEPGGWIAPGMKNIELTVQSNQA